MGWFISFNVADPSSIVDIHFLQKNKTGSLLCCESTFLIMMMIVEDREPGKPARKMAETKCEKMEEVCILQKSKIRLMTYREHIFWMVIRVTWRLMLLRTVNEAWS
jgi:hypothetical protein